MSDLPAGRKKNLIMCQSKIMNFFYFKVPKEFNFVEALDLYYKIHKVFQIPFHKHLQQVMGFIGAFVYQMNEDEALLSAKSLSFKHIISDSIDQQSN